MITPTTPSEHLLFSTVRIEAILGTAHSVGTGFFFEYPIDEQRVIPLIVTNKHVISGAPQGKFQLHESSFVAGKEQPSGQFFTVTIDQFQGLWIPHPNGDVDLCAMPFQPLAEEAKRLGKTTFYSPLRPNVILSDSALAELSALEDVVMVGYPTGLWDSVNNLPIIRRGTTATHPGVDFCGKSEGVVDLACYPGSSGSPVLIVNEGMYGTKRGTTVGTRMVLLGVLHAGPQWNAEGQIVAKEIPASIQVSSQTQIMIHLGYIIKAKELLVLGEAVQAKARRKGSL